MHFTKYLLILPLLTMGLSHAVAAEKKIAYVNMARALNDVSEGKAAKAALKKEFESKQKKIDKLQKELKTKQQEFEKKSAVMMPAARQEKQQTLQREFMTLQQTYMQLQQELMASENKATQKIAIKLRSIITKMGDKANYAMILDIGDTVLYYKRHLDITDAVIKAYDKANSK